MNKTSLTVIILAAGRGTRMKSPLPKVLHPVSGVPMIARVIDEAKKLNPFETRVVLGHGKSLIEPIITQKGAFAFEQKEQNGTAHAVLCAQPENIDGDILILNGDHPLLKAEDLTNALREFHDVDADIAVLTCILKNPKEFGRVVRQNDRVKAIVESKDASSDTLKIKEINTGAYIVKASVLNNYLSKIQPHNVQGEYYLTDLIALGVQDNLKVMAVKVSKNFAFGVNNQLQLSQATQLAVREKIKNHLVNGVIFINPASSYVESEVEIGAGSIVYPNSFLKGKTKIGQFCVIEPNTYIQDSTINDGAQIKFGSHLEKVIVGTKTQVGPYARLRPETHLGDDCRVGNFVEMKKVNFGDGSKANHLTYLGDAVIGKEVNIGCGTITCNYATDRKKYETHIGDGVFVGSDSQFIAPVKVGDGAVIGSGSTITKDVPARALGVARSKQVNIDGYADKLISKEKEK